MEGQTFEKLVGTLSEKERLELLERINKSMFRIEEEDETIKRKNLSQKERDLVMEKDFGRLPFLRRFIIGLLSKLSGKSRNDHLIQYKIKMLKKNVMKTNNKLTGFETRDLTPAFAEAVFALYVAIMPVRELYKRLWMNKAAFEGGLLYLLKSRLEKVQVSLEDVISLEELVDEYALQGLKEKLKAIVIEKLQTKIEGLPDALFKQVEEGLLPVYYLKELVLFPFISFFHMFHFNPQIEDLKDKPVFKSAPAVVALDFMEKLYYAVYIAGKIENPETLDKRILDYSFELMNLEGEEEREEEEPPEEERDAYIRSMTAAIQDVHRKVAAFNHHIPLAELIRYFTKDPYYQLVFYIPKMHLRDIYYHIMREKIVTELEERYQEIRKLYIQREINTLFQGKQLIPFHNYREYASIDYKKMGVPFFVHTRSLNLLYNFIKMNYREQIQGIIQLLQKGLLAQNRITQDRLLRHAAALEEVEDKIRLFDYSLSPESEDGKSFQRLRFMLASDPSQQRMYKTLVLQKERTVKSLISLGEESLEGLRKLFEEILTSPVDSIKEQLNNHYFIKGSSTRLSTALQERMDNLSRVRNLLSQLFKMEEG
ncbi:MAG: hypothetical protein JW760_02750 [Spirochaetales bacterium]|nr:hypothetical protein [Spirochaetales bacterium]